MKIASENVRPKVIDFMAYSFGPDRLVVRTLRCGRSNPGSNPDMDRLPFAYYIFRRGNTQRRKQK